MAKNSLAKLTSVSTGDYPTAPTGKQSKEDELRQRKYKAEDALRTLQRAAEIVKDKQLMADVATLAKEQAKNTQAALAHANNRRPAAA